MHQSSPRHALSDVISASQLVTTAQPMLGSMGVIGSIGGAGGGVSIGGAGAGGGVAELKPRFYDEVSEATIREHFPPNYYSYVLQTYNYSKSKSKSKCLSTVLAYTKQTIYLYLSIYQYLSLSLVP